MPAPTTVTPSALDILQNTFGYDHFRGHQADIIEALSEGEDCLVIMPTGGGKSLCYQIPALIRNGVGIVISPLIALMHDQVTALKQLGINAAFLNSTLRYEDINDLEHQLRAGAIDLLYIAPERILQERTLGLLQSLEIALFAIDEAHCVSQWGHDFRADYLQLHQLKTVFPNTPSVALTATADDTTQNDIVARLQLQNAKRFVSGFDRPNIQYRITQKKDPKAQLLKFIRKEHLNDAGIVYCLSRAKVEATAEWLKERGFDALPYHAGLSTDIRAQHQERFLRDENVIIVATIAFGMGIDKPDVRFVAHLDLPKSLEAYYQETGRAGRDGLPSTAWMVYGLQDVIKLRQMLDNSNGNEQHKRIEQHKLNAMLGLCEITSCRRQAILRYFGDTLDEPCGNCDTCLNPVETWDASVEVQKIMSCIYRTEQRFGANHIIDVLQGKDTDKIRQFRHHQVSTYGIGKDRSAMEWRSIIRQLVARGFLQVDMERYGALRLTDRCRPILRGEEHLTLRRDHVEPGTRGTRRSESAGGSLRKKPSMRAYNSALWDALRACRKQLADEHGVPPYVVFHDATLMEMMEEKPETPEELLRLNGVGESKLEKFGQAFLDVLREQSALKVPEQEPV